MKYRCAEILAKRLKELRGDKSQKDFARKLGIAGSQLNRLEQGVLNATLDTLDRICSSLKCQPSELFEKEKK